MLEFEPSSSAPDSDPENGASNGAGLSGVLTPREKRDIQKARLRPLAHRRPELYDEGDLPTSTSTSR